MAFLTQSIDQFEITQINADIICVTYCFPNGALVSSLLFCLIEIVCEIVRSHLYILVMLGVKMSVEEKNTKEFLRISLSGKVANL